MRGAELKGSLGDTSLQTRQRQCKSELRSRGAPQSRPYSLSASVPIASIAPV